MVSKGVLSPIPYRQREMEGAKGLGRAETLGYEARKRQRKTPRLLTHKARRTNQSSLSQRRLERNGLGIGRKTGFTMDRVS